MHATWQEEKILVVEPDEELAGELAEVLKKNGVSATMVSSHYKALAVLEDEWFPLILISADDTGIDGAEFCRIYRRRIMESKGGASYLMLMGQEWQRVPICEAMVPADDFIIRPFLDCELKWRISAGLRTLRHVHVLEELVYLDPETGALNQAGLQKVLLDEINRVGRKKGWLTIAVLDLARRHWMEVNQGRTLLTTARKKTIKLLAEFLRSHEHTGLIDNERICIILVDCDFQCAKGFFNRIRSQLEKLDMPFASGLSPDLELDGIFQSTLVDTEGGTSRKCFDYLWMWINSMDSLPHGIEPGIAVLDKEGMRLSDEISIIIKGAGE